MITRLIAFVPQSSFENTGMCQEPERARHAVSLQQVLLTVTNAFLLLVIIPQQGLDAG
jgi:hypothetical protein